MNDDMDITEATAPRSDQQNYDDYVGGSKIVTISGARKVGGEQPIELALQEFPGRPYKPNKSMCRVLLRVWGPDMSVYVGRQLELYGDPKVKWAGKEVGGIRIAGMSHIDGPRKVELTETRGVRKPFTVQPLQDAPKPPEYAAQVAKATTRDELNAIWQTARNAGHMTDELQTTFKARAAEIAAPADDDATLPVDGGDA